jgi:hypothetical protein
LKPGGRLVLVDMDVMSPFTMPPSEHYEGWLKTVPAHQDVVGVDYQVGLRLPQLLDTAGLTTTFFNVDQPIYNSGPGKLLWENTWRNTMPYRIQAGSIRQEDGDRLIAGIAAHNQRPDVWVAVVKMFAAVGEKPKN